MIFLFTILGICDKIIYMVLLNYEKFIEEKIGEQVSRLPDVRLLQVCLDPLFKELMIKLYEYCE